MKSRPHQSHNPWDYSTRNERIERIPSAEEIRGQKPVFLEIHLLDPCDPSLPPPPGRFEQLCALAADPNEDTAAAAESDLFREFNSTPCEQTYDSFNP
jgi:hypothetical protein